MGAFVCRDGFVCKGGCGCSGGSDGNGAVCVVGLKVFCVLSVCVSGGCASGLCIFSAGYPICAVSVLCFSWVCGVTESVCVSSCSSASVDSICGDPPGAGEYEAF